MPTTTDVTSLLSALNPFSQLARFFTWAAVLTQNKPITHHFQSPNLPEGIEIVRFHKDNLYKPIRETVCNFNEVRKKIICLLGDCACSMYGLNENIN